MKDIMITDAHLRGGLFGAVVGAVLMGAVWVGSAKSLVDTLVPFAQCDGKGWVTVRFPGGGEYTCTPTEQKPLNAKPALRKIKPVKKIDLIDLPEKLPE